MPDRRKALSFMLLTALLLPAVLPAGASPAADEGIPFPVFSFDPETVLDRNEVLRHYRDAASVDRLFLVLCGEQSAAKTVLYAKTAGGKWGTVFEADADIGKNGTGKTVEGDMKTPVGDFGVRRAFGILPDPGTPLEYLAVTPSVFACNEDCPYYNRIIDTSETGHVCRGEEMYRYTPQYDYGIELDFNPENIYPNGSAIFIHCRGTRPYTAGCIALDKNDMRTLLLNADETMRVIIGRG